MDVEPTVSPLSLRFGDEPMGQAEIVSSNAGTASVFSSPRPGRVDDNEDHGAVIFLPDGSSVLAVADGVGGQPGGAQASRAAIDALVRSVVSAGPTRLRPAILDGFEAASRAVRDLGLGAGTTLAVVEIEHRVLRPYHVGDSMILVVGQRGRIKYQAIPHSPVGYAIEAGLLEEGEAMHHDDRHVVSNLVGDEEMRIEIGPHLPLGDRDTALLASDGVSDNLHLDEIVGSIRKGPLAEASQHLVEACHERMHAPPEGSPTKPDDMTFVLYRSR